MDLINFYANKSDDLELVNRLDKLHQDDINQPYKDMMNMFYVKVYQAVNVVPIIFYISDQVALTQTRAVGRAVQALECVPATSHRDWVIQREPHFSVRVPDVICMWRKTMNTLGYIVHNTPISGKLWRPP